MKFVGVSSCPTGIAHTYMAAEALEQEAKKQGHEMVVETQGSAGTIPIDAETIAAADGVIFAADLEVRNKERFAGKPTIDVGVKKGVHDAPGVIAQAVAAVEAARANPQQAAALAAAAPKGPATKVTANAGVGTRIRQWLMTGVSYMIPFVAAGGLLIALGFLFGTDDVVPKLYGGSGIIDKGQTWTAVWTGFNTFADGKDIYDLLGQAGIAGLFFILGKIAFGMLVPILSGFIAYAIADRPGLVPGIVGGLIAGIVGAGFLGGLVSGFLAGGIAYYLSHLKVPKGVRGIMPVVVIPLISVILTGGIMFVVLGKVLASITTGLTNWLEGLSGTSGIILGIIVGLMMAFDMGGPVNKAAYTFATGVMGDALTNGETTGTPFTIMAAVMAAGMTPPLALALATLVRKSLFTEAERENGIGCWLLGLSFITEGAIPFAAARPLQVIPSVMAGSAVTGALVMAFGSGVPAPHGGIFVVALVGKPALWLLAIVVGTVISAVVLIALMSVNKAKTEELVAEQDAVAAHS